MRHIKSQMGPFKAEELRLQKPCHLYRHVKVSRSLVVSLPEHRNQPHRGKEQITGTDRNLGKKNKKNRQSNLKFYS